MKKLLRSFISLNPTSLTFIVTLLVVVLFLIEVPIFDLFELKTYDLRFLSRGRLEPSPEVVLATIDEKSLDLEGRWPWPRWKIARLIDILSQDGAKVIGFDIGFLEPDENSQLSFINELDQKVGARESENKELAEFLKESRLKADNDVILANSIRRSSAKVVLGYFFHTAMAGGDYRIEEDEIERRLHLLESSEYPQVVYEGETTPNPPFLKAYAPESNLPILSEAAGFSGYFNMMTDSDGLVRWMPLIIGCGEEIFPPLSILSAWLYLDQPRLVVGVATQGVEGIHMGERFIPTDENGRLLINYLGPARTFPHYSISDILRGNVAKGTFQGKIVLAGGTALGIHDLRNTPFSPVYPGLEVHSTIIDNVLTQRFLNKPHWTKIYDLLAILVLSMVVGMVLPRVGAIKGLLFTSGLFASHILVAHWLFVSSSVWLNMVYPLLGLTSVFISLTVYHYLTEERERKKVRNAFSRYVSDTVINEMLKDPKRLKLGGQVKTLTVLFSDLAGFTSHSERLPPEEMINILSEYFGEMTERVFNHEGMLKEYVGDELMAIFGAPLEQSDHAARACEAALEMRERLRSLREEWEKVGRPPLKARTGVNSGPMLVGNLGSRYRFAYGVLGDNVNLGSRLEGLNKAYGTEILIGENTAELIKGGFLLRELDVVRVKGKKLPVRVYELLGNSDASLTEEQRRLLDLYASGLETYRQQRWDEAMSYFEDALGIIPEDGPSRVMVGRCQIYQSSPPPPDWDGVFVMKTK